MAGRINDSAQEVAAAKVSDVGPYAGQIQDHLREILASRAFQGSRRCQEFLAYVVEHALLGDFGGLKERVLGIRIFSRDPGYDTSDDSIVRVTASDVRKRLLQYYKISAPSQYRIELQSGSYIPEFHVHDEVAPVHASTFAPAPAARVVASVQAVSLPSGGITVAEPPPIEEVKPLRLPKRLRWVVVIVAAFGLFAAGWAASSLSYSFQPGVRERARYSFYRDLLGPMVTDPSRSTYIVFSNPILYLYRGSPSLDAAGGADGWEREVPIPQTLASQLQSRATDAQADPGNPFLGLDTTDYTGLGEAKTAFYLQKLFGTFDRSSYLTEARFLNWEQAQSRHLIFLGAPHMSAWIQNNLAPVAFTMDHDLIRNLHPLPGEQAVYARTFHGKVLEDYGLIWMSRSPSGSQMLVLAGLTSTGTAGVGEFFADPVRMKPVFEKLRDSTPDHTIPNNWQILVRIAARDKVPLDVSFITLRTSNGKGD